MQKAIIKKGDATVIRNADVTTKFAERFKGLMFVQSIPDNYGLLIKPCKQIHMLNMKFPLDVIYLSADNKVVHIDENIRPGQIGKTIKEAQCVIEVNSGTCARCGINIDDILTVEYSN